MNVPTMKTITVMPHGLTIFLMLSLKATVLQIIVENHELCKYAKKSLHIHIIVDLNQNIA